MQAVATFPDQDTLAEAAAQHIVTLAKEAITTRGRFSIALSGGSTPKQTLSCLASDEFAPMMDWQKVHVFWGDERCVPPDHPDSNSLMAREVMLDRVPIPIDNIHRIQAELNPTDAAHIYETELRAFFQEVPRFDLVLLGMGDDGHTASLFPGTEALIEEDRWVVANYIARLSSWRITLTPIAITAAANITFLVSGAHKAERLHEVLNGPYKPRELPSQLVKPLDGRLRWLVDADAARLLND
jgi:6-phosphogluconolactonase